MSFYSALVLAANTDVRVPSDREMQALLFNLGILKTDDPGDQYGELAADITGLFRNAPTLTENPHFFCPDSVGFGTQIDIFTPDAEEVFTQLGYCVRLHGSGYFFPWTGVELRERVLHTPKLRRLREVLQTQLGGRLVVPHEHEPALREAWLDGADDGWVWFGCESV